MNATVELSSAGGQLMAAPFGSLRNGDDHKNFGL
jgi:hypothetical protein